MEKEYSELYNLIDDVHTALAKSTMDEGQYNVLSTRLVNAKRKLLAEEIEERDKRERQEEEIALQKESHIGSIVRIHDLRKIKKAIIDAQAKYEYCILDKNDTDNVAELINHAYKDSFGIDLFGTDD